MKYAFIQRDKLVWPISMQCRVLLVSVSGYHAHLARGVDIAQRRRLPLRSPDIVLWQTLHAKSERQVLNLSYHEELT